MKKKRKNWKEMTFPLDGMIWGEKPAAALTDGFLTQVSLLYILMSLLQPL